MPPNRVRDRLRGASLEASRDPEGRPGARGLSRRRARFVLWSLRASIVVQLVLAVGKVTLGGALDQPYVLAGALVNAGALVAKMTILLGTGADPRRGGHHSPYVRTGVVVLVTGLAYSACCLAAALEGTFSSYGRGVAIAIATSAFVELGAAAVGTLTARRLWTPLVQADKLVNLAGGLVALALTQVAILSFTADGSRTGTANAAFTVATGLAVAGIGAGMVLHGRARLRAVGARAGCDDDPPSA